MDTILEMYRVTREKIETLTTQIQNRNQRNIPENFQGVRIEELTDELFRCLDKEYMYLKERKIELGAGWNLLEGSVNRFLGGGSLSPYAADQLLKRLREVLTPSLVWSPQLSSYEPWALFLRTLWRGLLYPETLAKTISWAIDDLRPYDIEQWYRIQDTIIQIITTRDLDPSFLHGLCLHPYALVANSAAQNPNCPEDGRTIAALRNLPIFKIPATA
jgi:hypothetical protein